MDEEKAVAADNHWFQNMIHSHTPIVLRTTKEAVTADTSDLHTSIFLHMDKEAVADDSYGKQMKNRA